MSDELLRAILDNPEDLQVRLVYADWLEDQGELDRAAVIRTECELDEVPRWDDRWIAHWSFCAQHRGAQPLPSLPGGLQWQPFHHRRGFPERLLINRAEAFLEHAPALFARAPIRALDINAHEANFPLERLLASPWLGRIRRLHIHGHRLDADTIRWLVESEHVRQVDKLRLSFGKLTGDGLRALLGSRFATQLVKLDLSVSFVAEGERPFETFAEAPPLPKLSQLDLSTNRLDDGRALHAVIDNPNLSFRSLSLAGNPLEDAGWLAVVGAPHLHLEELDLTATRPRLSSVQALVDSPRRTSLRVLRLRNNQLGPRAAAVLAAAAWPELQFLDGELNNFGEDGLQALKSSRGFPRLRRAPWLGST